MDKMKKSSWSSVAAVLFAAVVFVSSCAPVYGNEETDKLNSRIRQAKMVFEDMQKMPETSIPEDLIRNCAGIAIFPSVVKGAFGIGGMYGQGVLLRRDKATGQWSPPVFMSIGGASIGFQIGGQATDMILVVGNERGMDALSRNDVTLGADAAVAAGPVGRNAAADTDALLRAGILSYSRSKGLFAGVSLKGAVVGPMKNLIKDYYGGDTTASDVLFSGKAQPTAEGQELMDMIAKY